MFMFILFPILFVAVLAVTIVNIVKNVKTNGISALKNDEEGFAMMQKRSMDLHMQAVNAHNDMFMHH